MPINLVHFADSAGPGAAQAFGVTATYCCFFSVFGTLELFLEELEKTGLGEHLAHVEKQRRRKKGRKKCPESMQFQEKSILRSSVLLSRSSVLLQIKPQMIN